MIPQHLNSQVFQPSCIYQSTKELYGMIPNTDVVKNKPSLCQSSYICPVLQQELGASVMAAEASFVQRGDSVHGEGVYMEALQEEDHKTVKYKENVRASGAAVGKPVHTAIELILIQSEGFLMGNPPNTHR